MKVYVVGFAPTPGCGAIGGFDWFPKIEDARQLMMKYVVESDDSHSLTFVPLDVPDEAVVDGNARESITSWIDSNLHLVEVSVRELA